MDTLLMALRELKLSAMVQALERRNANSRGVMGSWGSRSGCC